MQRPVANGITRAQAPRGRNIPRCCDTAVLPLFQTGTGDGTRTRAKWTAKTCSDDGWLWLFYWDGVPYTLQYRLDRLSGLERGGGLGGLATRCVVTSTNLNWKKRSSWTGCGVSLLVFVRHKGSSVTSGEMGM